MDQAVVRGRNIVVGVIVVVISISLFVALMDGFLNPGAKLVRFILELILLYFMWRGATWARVVVAVLLIMGGLLGLVATIIDPVMGVVGLIDLACAGLLLFSPSVVAFQQYQRDQG